MIFVKRRCDERIATLFFNIKPAEAEQGLVHHITDGYHILTVDYERSYYDASKVLRGGL